MSATKKMLLAAAATMLAIATMAQNVTLTLEEPGKMLYHSHNPQLIGSQDGSAVVLDMMGRKTILARYDMAQNELAKVELAREKETNCYGGFVNGDAIDLLMTQTNDDGLRAWHERRDYTTLEPIAESKTLTDLRGDKKDDFFYTISSSPNNELVASLSIVSRKALEPEARVSLYSRRMENYWHMPISISSFNQMLVTDSGEVVLANCTTNSDKPCTFTIVDGENEQHASFSIEEKVWVSEAKLVSYAHGKLVVAVSVCSDHRVVMPVGSNINRIDFYCYDVKNGKLKVTRYNITDQESARMANRKEGQGTKGNWVQFGTLTQTIADNDGGYLMIDQTWIAEQNGIPMEQHRMGMMVIRTDEEGQVQWTRTLRLSSECLWNHRDMLDYSWRTTADGIMLATTQNAKNATLPAEKPIKNYKTQKDNSILAVYTLDKQGNMSQHHFDLGKRAMIRAPRYIDSRNFMVFLLGGGKGQFGQLAIEKR